MRWSPARSRRHAAVLAALIRRFGHGQVVGPGITPDSPGTKALLARWLGSRSSQFIRLDLPNGGGLSR